MQTRGSLWRFSSTIVICGQKLISIDGKSKAKISSRFGNHCGVIVSPDGRLTSLVPVAHQLLAQKMRVRK